VFSIRERNLMFCQMVKDVLGLRDGKDWIDVRRELSDEQVKEIHEAYASLWPEDTSLSELLPRPRSDVLRAVYLGPVDSRSIGATVLGWLPVFDQIVVASPFVNPLRIREQYSPTKSPSKFKFQTLRNVLLLLRLEPFIFSGDLHMVPDPSDFDSQYGQSVMRSADRLAQGIEALPKLGGWPRLLAADEMRHLIRGMPEEELRRMLRKSNSGITEQMLAACVEMNKAELEADPFALLQPMLAGEEGSQYLAFKGYGLATAMYLAALSGAVIYTDEDFHWKQLHQLAAHAPLETLMPLIQGVLPIEFSIDVNSHMLELRLDEGKFGHLKAAFRRVAAAVSQSSHSVDVEYLVAELAAAAQSTNVFKGNDVEQRELAGRIEISAPSGGFISNDVGRLLLTFGKAPVNRPMPFAMRIIFDRLNELDDHDDSPASA
jgi:hypothetical protein